MIEIIPFDIYISFLTYVTDLYKLNHAVFIGIYLTKHLFFHITVHLKGKMESTKKTVPPKSRDQIGKGKHQNCDTGDIQEKLKKVDVKTSSPTSLLAKNSLVLPTGVIKPERVKAKTETMPSSGSATGKNVRLFLRNIDSSNYLNSKK